MAQQSGGNVPQIRFQGFEGEWADKPIGEVLAEKKRPIVLKDRQRYELISRPCKIHFSNPSLKTLIQIKFSGAGCPPSQTVR